MTVMRHLLTGLTSVIFLTLLVSCQKEKSIELRSLAEGSLQSDAGACLPKNVLGTYLPGRDLNDSNAIEVTVNVTTPGRYTVSTDTVNGYAFKASGVFTTAGPATLRLKGGGKPATAGLDLFLVVFDSSVCEVAVVVGGGGGGQPVGGDYFPLSQNSWWSYDDGQGSDSLKITVLGTGTFNNRTYQRFIRTDDTGPVDTAFYRKDAGTGFYYEGLDTEPFSGIATFTQPRIDVLFLKSNVKTNDTWNSDHPATASGIPVIIRLKSTVLDNNFSLAVNGIPFTKLLRVRQDLQVVLAGNATTLESAEYLYAQNIGRVRYEDVIDEHHIRNWKVN